MNSNSCEGQILALNFNEISYTFMQQSKHLVVLSNHPQHFYYSIVRYQDLDSVVKSEFANIQELFQSLCKSSSPCLEFCVSNRLKVNFSRNNKVQQIAFPLEEWKDRLVSYEKQTYQKKIEELIKENRLLTKENHEREQKIQELEADKILMRLNCDSLEKQLKTLQQQFKDRGYHERQKQFNVTHLPAKTSYKVPLNSIDYNTQIENKKKQKFEFIPTLNENYKKLNIFHFKGNRIQVQSERKDFYQVFSEHPIHLDKLTCVSIKVIKSRLSNIYFGVFKESRRKEKFTCQHQESLSYKLKGGKFLFEDGIQSGEEIPRVKEGDTLNLSIDPKSSQVTWFIEGKFMLKRKLPASMTNFLLYVFVSLHNAGDEVEIN